VQENLDMAGSQSIVEDGGGADGSLVKVEKPLVLNQF